MYSQVFTVNDNPVPWKIVRRMGAIFAADKKSGEGKKATAFIK